jgi:hypothetical protein
VQQEFTYITALLLGLFSGVHCIGMCGGIVGVLTVNLDPAQTSATRLGKQLFYNIGRISSYTMFGLLAGSFGQASSLLLHAHALQTGLTIMAAIFMFAMGLYLAGWWHGLLKLEQLGQPLWRRLEPLTRGMIPVRNLKQAYIVGAVWGWLPCGLVYSVAIFALSSGSAINGGVLMFSFGLGTLPNLLAAGLLATPLLGLLRHRSVKGMAGLLVMGFALVLLYRVVRLLSN